MRPLQQHLREAGCVGLLWQAGFGNPVAGGNFMIDPTATSSEDRWIWIDLESGIPPLVPMNPLVLLRFYLPQMLRRRALLFDDIDVRALKAYVLAHREALEASGGDIASLWADVDQLATTQYAWKALDRRERSVAYAQARGWIRADEASDYLRRPFRWYARQAGWAAKAIGRTTFGGARALASKVVGAQWRVYIRSVRSFVASQQFRTRVSRRYVVRRLIAWRSRGFLDRESLRDLRASVASDSAARDISDFGVHVALKAPVSIVQWWVLPFLFLVGAIDGVLLTAGVVFGESAVRTLYTGARTIQCWLAGHELPWVAMFVGLIPLVGVSAFPAQMLYSGTSREKRLSRFIVHDTFASIGRAVPIWGGNDSLIEHAFNRVPSLLFRRDTPNRTASVPVTLVRLPAARDAVDRDRPRR